ncbi:hypothetical protein EBR77_00675 [bacterium]|nr:hypothetical protein [bacterium]
MHIDNEKLLINLIEKRKLFWEPIVAAALLLMAILGVMVPLYIHSDNANRALIEAIRKDIKEFHDAQRLNFSKQ